MSNLTEQIELIKYDDNGLVPAIAQEASTGEVLMLAYMNKEALTLTLETGEATYFSRSRNEIWVKGKTSGNSQTVREVLYDCDCDTILVIVDQKGVACHTGERNCFFKTFNSGQAVRLPTPWVLADLARTLKERKTAPEDKSYTASLYKKGKGKIIEKIKEECSELVEALQEKDSKEVVYELTDLWFHTMVALENEDIDIKEVFSEFQRRFGVSGITEKENRLNKK